MGLMLCLGRANCKYNNTVDKAIFALRGYFYPSQKASMVFSYQISLLPLALFLVKLRINCQYIGMYEPSMALSE